MRWTARRVAEALGTPCGTDPNVVFAAIGTDTRTLRGGSLFVALSGKRFDGHDFLADAARCGALAAVVRRGTAAVPGLVLCEVDDPLVALGRLARARRAAFPGTVPVVAVTGTNGKTTTKEMIAAVLATTFRVHATRATLNNLVGVPLTLLAAPDEADALVVEVGTNQPGEIARLRNVVAPTVGVITMVGAGHLAGLGTVEGVLVEKVALLSGVRLAVVGTEPPVLAQRARELARTVVAGLGTRAEVRPDRWCLGPDGRATCELAGTTVTIPLPGPHQLANAMLAVAVGDALGVDRRASLRALETVRFPGGRMEVCRVAGFTVLNDCYNSNPDSLRAALTAFEPLRQGRRSVIVVGTMLELGADSAAWHAALARDVADARPDVIAAVGEFATAFRALEPQLGVELVTGPDADAVGVELRQRLRGDEVILLKGSRAVALERILGHLTR